MLNFQLACVYSIVSLKGKCQTFRTQVLSHKYIFMCVKSMCVLWYMYTFLV